KSAVDLTRVVVSGREIFSSEWNIRVHVQKRRIAANDRLIDFEVVFGNSVQGPYQHRFHMNIGIERLWARVDSSLKVCLRGGQQLRIFLLGKLLEIHHAKVVEKQWM